MDNVGVAVNAPPDFVDVAKLDPALARAVQKMAKGETAEVTATQEALGTKREGAAVAVYRLTLKAFRNATTLGPGATVKIVDRGPDASKFKNAKAIGADGEKAAELDDVALSVEAVEGAGEGAVRGPGGESRLSGRVSSRRRRGVVAASTRRRRGVDAASPRRRRGVAATCSLRRHDAH